MDAKLEMLREADYVLDSCGRLVPPPGFRFVDLPSIIPFHFDINVSGGDAPTQTRVANLSNTLFLCRGIAIPFSSGFGFQIKWPTGRYFNQFPFNFGSPFQIPVGQGGAMLALDVEVPLEPDARVGIEVSGQMMIAVVDIQFWGVLRYLLKATDSTGRADASCIVGYPTLGKSVSGGGLETIADPVWELERRPRFRCSPNQNIMAPELLLGDQRSETPAGWQDESFTFFSPPITCNLADQSFGNVVLVPGSDDVVIKRIRTMSVQPDAGSAVPVFAIRLPNGYSLTGGDLVPAPFLGWWPVFPSLRVQTGGRLIIDMADIQAVGAGPPGIVTTFEFDCVKRRRIQ